MEDIAELLKETREEAGIELEEVSKDLNIDDLILRNIEEGKIGAFKDIFVLKDYIFEYAKYLGLNCDNVMNDFNEYLFEYTSKIPVAQIEKEIQQSIKDEEDKVISPYTATKIKISNDGKVFPCHYFTQPEYSLGSIYDEDFSIIINRID